MMEGSDGMPLRNNQEFVQKEFPSKVTSDTKVYYIPLTNEAFTSYDEFFARHILITSKSWTCSITGKTDLSLEEALKSECSAKDIIYTFPDALSTPLLYLVHKFSYRKRIDELVEDVYSFIRGHFFIGEELTYMYNHARYPVTVIGVSFIGDNFVTEPDESIKVVSSKTIDDCESHFKYHIKISGKSSVKFDFYDKENVDHHQLSRPKSVASRSKLKLYLGSQCILVEDRLILKEHVVNSRNLSILTWEDIFCGPAPAFPRSSHILIPSVSTHSKSSGSGRHGVYARDSPCTKKVDGRGQSLCLGPKSKILLQQEELSFLFETAKRLGVDKVTKWIQQKRLLKEVEINMLKKLVRIAKIRERKKIIESKRRERMGLIEWAKIRDDLKCDDLRPLPVFSDLILPRWIDEDNCVKCLEIYQFFRSFGELLSKQQHGNGAVEISDVINAVCNCDPESSSFVELIRTLFTTKAKLVGEEVEFDYMEECAFDMFVDFDQKPIGESVRRAAQLYQDIKQTFGISVNQLHIESLTVTEVIRLSLLSSGHYYYRCKMAGRTWLQSFNDEGFLFARNQSELVESLQMRSVFDLGQEGRAKLLNVFMEQLSSCSEFRAFLDEKVSVLNDLRKELRHLRNLESAQAREAKEVSHLREIEIELQNETDKLENRKFFLSKKTRRILHLASKRNSNVCTRERDLGKIEELLMDSVSYNELKLDEIVQIRNIQKECISQKTEKVLDNIFEIQACLGWNLLGRDRAYRSYWYFNSLPLLLVESPLLDNGINECCEATPLDKVSKDFLSSANSEHNARVNLFCCTASPDCPVHANRPRARWQVIDSKNVLDALIHACNPRGFRESALLENLEYFRSSLARLFETCEIPFIRQMQKIEFPQIRLIEYDWVGAIVKRLLEFEEKVEKGGIGHLAIREFSQNRQNWRNCLLRNQQVSCFVSDVNILKNLASDKTHVSDLVVVRELSIALLQIALGINAFFIREPFAISSVEVPHQKSASLCFENWQKSLSNCLSISAVGLHNAVFEACIIWERSRFHARCRECMRGHSREKLVMCIRCCKFHHVQCVGPPLSEVADDWVCSGCLIAVNQHEVDEKSRRRNVQKYSESNNCADSSDGDASSSQENRALSDDVRCRRIADYGMHKTASGRLVKKVTYAEDILASEKELPKRRNNRESSESDRDEEVVLNKRRRLHGARRVLRPVSMSSHQKDCQNREALAAVESLLINVMRKKIALPFNIPVDGEDAPDYHNIVKNPMDFGTVLKKLKESLYSTCESAISDIKLVFSNCRLYYDQGSEIEKRATKLESLIDQKLDEMALTSHSYGRTRYGRR